MIFTWHTHCTGHTGIRATIYSFYKLYRPVREMKRRRPLLWRPIYSALNRGYAAKPSMCARSFTFTSSSLDSLTFLYSLIATHRTSHRSLPFYTFKWGEMERGDSTGWEMASTGSHLLIPQCFKINSNSSRLFSNEESCFFNIKKIQIYIDSIPKQKKVSKT